MLLSGSVDSLVEERVERRGGMCMRPSVSRYEGEGETETRRVTRLSQVHGPGTRDE